MDLFNISEPLFLRLVLGSGCLLGAFIPQENWGPSSTGPHGVSSRDNRVPSVTTVRITEHNGGSAAVKPAQGKQQEAVVVDSAMMKTTSLWLHQHIWSPRKK